MNPTNKEIARFWKRVRWDEEGCWEWKLGRSPFGYGITYIGGRQEKAHRVSWTLFNGSIPVGLHVCHSCDNPPCVRPDHLFLGTDADNLRDMRQKGRANHFVGRPQKGELNHARKLTEEAVREIRRLSAEGVRQREIARRFGVRQGTISLVVLGQTWSHVR